ncbi:unnamed protein product [Amoebophrya sp. A120]|nr:unnamed protein product [Amoebophrya sp. A120]|eukprot:GSA120T00007321001.1
MYGNFNSKGPPGGPPGGYPGFGNNGGPPPGGPPAALPGGGPPNSNPPPNPYNNPNYSNINEATSAEQAALAAANRFMQAPGAGGPPGTAGQQHHQQPSPRDGQQLQIPHPQGGGPHINPLVGVQGSPHSAVGGGGPGVGPHPPGRSPASGPAGGGISGPPPRGPPPGTSANAIPLGGGGSGGGNMMMHHGGPPGGPHGAGGPHHDGVVPAGGAPSGGPPPHHQQFYNNSAGGGGGPPGSGGPPGGPLPGAGGPQSHPGAAPGPQQQHHGGYNQGPQHQQHGAGGTNFYPQHHQQYSGPGGKGPTSFGQHHQQGHQGAGSNYHQQQHQNNPENMNSKIYPWTTQSRNDGSKYYFNLETGKAQWLCPKELMSDMQLKIAKLTPWREMSLWGDRLYYYNSETRVTCWREPDAVRRIREGKDPYEGSDDAPLDEPLVQQERLRLYTQKLERTLDGDTSYHFSSVDSMVENKVKVRKKGPASNSTALATIDENQVNIQPQNKQNQNFHIEEVVLLPEEKHRKQCYAEYLLKNRVQQEVEGEERRKNAVFLLGKEMRKYLECLERDELETGTNIDEVQVQFLEFADLNPIDFPSWDNVKDVSKEEIFDQAFNKFLQKRDKRQQKRQQILIPQFHAFLCQHEKLTGSLTWEEAFQIIENDAKGRRFVSELGQLESLKLWKIFLEMQNMPGARGMLHPAVREDRLARQNYLQLLREHGFLPSEVIPDPMESDLAMSSCSSADEGDNSDVNSQLSGHKPATSAGAMANNPIVPGTNVRVTHTTANPTYSRFSAAVGGGGKSTSKAGGAPPAAKTTSAKAKAANLAKHGTTMTSFTKNHRPNKTSSKQSALTPNSKVHAWEEKLDLVSNCNTISELEKHLNIEPRQELVDDGVNGGTNTLSAAASSANDDDNNPSGSSSAATSGPEMNMANLDNLHDDVDMANVEDDHLDLQLSPTSKAKKSVALMTHKLIDTQTSVEKRIIDSRRAYFKQEILPKIREDSRFKKMEKIFQQRNTVSSVSSPENIYVFHEEHKLFMRQLTKLQNLCNKRQKKFEHYREAGRDFLMEKVSTIEEPGMMKPGLTQVLTWSQIAERSKRRRFIKQKQRAVHIDDDMKTTEMMYQNQGQGVVPPQGAAGGPPMFSAFGQGEQRKTTEAGAADGVHDEFVEQLRKANSTGLEMSHHLELPLPDIPHPVPNLMTDMGNPGEETEAMVRPSRKNSSMMNNENKTSVLSSAVGAASNAVAPGSLNPIPEGSQEDQVEEFSPVHRALHLPKVKLDPKRRKSVNYNAFSPQKGPVDSIIGKAGSIIAGGGSTNAAGDIQPPGVVSGTGAGDVGAVLSGNLVGGDVGEDDSGNMGDENARDSFEDFRLEGPMGGAAATGVEERKRNTEEEDDAERLSVEEIS